jgi:hypothetical protein
VSDRHTLRFSGFSIDADFNADALCDLYKLVLPLKERVGISVHGNFKILSSGTARSLKIS